MGYILNQYNQGNVSAVSAANDINTKYMTLISNGKVLRRDQVSTSDAETGFNFQDVVVKFDNNLQKDKSYYFHGKIKREEQYDQQFKVKLFTYQDNGGINDTPTEQFIKTIVVKKGKSDTWLDIEFIFTPLEDLFDTLCFDLQRIQEDYSTDTRRYPTIIFEELSLINNLIGSAAMPKVSLLKIGVQGTPGSLMCINNEAIRIGRSGIYELRNGFIKIYFWSMINAASDASLPATMSELVSTPSTAAAEKSKCLFSNTKTRAINSFTLDYLYEEGAS